VAGLVAEDAGMETITDPRPTFASALATATDVVARIQPDQWGLATPCEDFDVHGMVTHLLAVIDRVTAVATQSDPFAVEPRPVSTAQWNDACAALWQVWSDDAVLDIPSPLPWAPGDAAAALASFTTELTLHAWDLAAAIGIEVEWDEAVLADVAARMAETLPATGRAAFFAPFKEGLPFTPPDPFVDAVPVAEDAPLVDRIVAWYGRQP
jgi:uncharacterized protein (TIGR03086 family)